MTGLLPRPSLMLAPLRYLPSKPLELLIAEASTRLLAEPLEDGALSGLADGALRVELTDPDIVLRFTVANGRVRPAQSDNDTRVVVRAALEDLLLVTAQRMDPDTLFFQRRLRVEGDTALGLEVKNLLDTVDPATLPVPMQGLLGRAADTIPGSR